MQLKMLSGGKIFLWGSAELLTFDTKLSLNLVTSKDAIGL